LDEENGKKLAVVSTGGGISEEKSKKMGQFGLVNLLVDHV
jgi:hypothetical protein